MEPIRINYGELRKWHCARGRSVSQTTRIIIELRALTGRTYPAFLVGVHLADNLSSETLHLFELWTALQEK
jgi:hypothetical protein